MYKHTDEMSVVFVFGWRVDKHKAVDLNGSYCSSVTVPHFTGRNRRIVTYSKYFICL